MRLKMATDWINLLSSTLEENTKKSETCFQMLRGEDRRLENELVALSKKLNDTGRKGKEELVN